jgi:hypothetical protein
MTIEEVLRNPDLEDGKANFENIYNDEDPRKYYEELGSLNYEIPHHGQRVFSALIEAQADGRGDATPTVLDLCCSYGIIGALLRCDLTMADLVHHYRSREVAGLSSEEMIEVDRAYYADHLVSDPPTIAGLDVSDRAIAYAQEVGLLAYGAAENLEESPPTPDLAGVVAKADLITVTGGVGYITAKTFARLIDARDGTRAPWLAAFTLRRYSYHDIADVLAERGLVTERLVGRTFPQRRFSCEEERDFTLRHLDESGLDVTGKEADGCFHTELYLSRPAGEVAERPLDELLGEPAGRVQRV